MRFLRRWHSAPFGDWALGAELSAIYQNERVYRQLVSAGLMPCFDFEENDGMSATLLAAQPANYVCRAFDPERLCIIVENKPRLLDAVN